VAVDVTGPD